MTKTKNQDYQGHGEHNAGDTKRNSKSLELLVILNKF